MFGDLYHSATDQIFNKLSLRWLSAKDDIDQAGRRLSRSRGD